MKLKNSVTNKLNKMSQEELIGLINNLCDSNEEVVSYLNNVLTNTKVDANISQELKNALKVVFLELIKQLISIYL